MNEHGQSLHIEPPALQKMLSLWNSRAYIQDFMVHCIHCCVTNLLCSPTILIDYTFSTAHFFNNRCFRAFLCLYPCFWQLANSKEILALYLLLHFISPAIFLFENNSADLSMSGSLLHPIPQTTPPNFFILPGLC